MNWYDDFHNESKELAKMWRCRFGCPPWFSRCDILSYDQIKKGSGDDWELVLLQATQIFNWYIERDFDDVPF